MTFAYWFRRLPWLLLATAAALAWLGWLGIARAEYQAGSSGAFARRQIVWCVLSLVAMLTVTVPSYRVLCRWTYAVFAAVLLLLVLVYFWPAVHGVHRWMRIGPLSLQPSEFAKVAYVLAMARWLMYAENYRSLRGLLAPLALTMVPVLLILREPDLGTALVFVPVLFAMLYAAGARRRDLSIVVVAGLMLLPVLWSQMSREQRSRITALAQQAGAGEKPTDDGYQLFQSKRVMAMGGWWGSVVQGEVPSASHAYHLPEAHCDFVFSILRERFGICGAAAVLALYGVVLWCILQTAATCREPFGRMVAVGIAALIAVQVVINTGMTVGLVPITGMSLPLVSYGGSGLLAHAVALGLVLNIALRPGYEVSREPFRFAT